MVQRPGESVHKGILAWWARNSVAANLLMIIAFVGGIIGFLQLQREVFPSGVFNGASVSVAWPGAAPQEVEEQIILRIEEAVANLPGVNRITATAFEGRGVVNIEGRRNLDANEFVNEIKLRVDSINNLPADAFRPVVQRWESQQQMYMVALHGDVDRRELQRLAREIRDEIGSQVGEASIVNTMAYLPEEVAIEVSEDALRRYGLTFSEVAQAIRASSLNASAGAVRTAQGRIQLTSRQLADTAEQFGDIIIRQTPDGSTIRVRDVARVTDGLVDVDFSGTFNGQTMVLIDVRTTGEIDVVRLSAQMERYVERKRGELPSSVTLSNWFDMSDAYHSRMDSISNSAMIGLTLVLIVLVLFLRPIVAFWVTVGIATAFAGGLLLLPMLGVTLNMLSLFAFLIVIGVVVDDAIIVGENIHTRVERGERGLTAAVVGVQMVAKPVLFAVITTMMAFAPWMLLSGPEVQFTRQISLVVIAALTFSLIEALLILPSHLSHLKPQRLDGAFGPLLRTQRAISEGLVTFARRVYAPVLALAIRMRYFTVLAFVMMFTLAIMLMNTGYVPFRFMPEVENELVQVNITLPEGAPWSRLEDVRTQLERAAVQLNDHYAERFPGFDMVQGAAVIANQSSVRAWIQITSPEDRPQPIPMSEIAQTLREAMGPVPDAEEIDFDFTISENITGVQFAVNHPDLDVLREAAADLKAHLHTYSATYDIVDNLQTSAEEMRFSLRPDARALGLTLADVTSQVRQAFYGVEVQRLPRGGEDVRVMVRYPRELRDSLDAVRDLRIRTPDGREIPLASVAEVEFAPGISRINRRERQRTVTVSAQLSDPDAAGDIRRDLRENFFPEWKERHPGVTEGALGDVEGQAQFMQEILILQILVMGSMYVLLAIAFRSYAQPLLIMTAIPFAFAGAVFGHLAFNMPIALFSFFGVGAAAGVVINNNLVMVDFVNRLRERGVGAFQSLVETGVQRFRPILLTTLTTFLGILPMMAERSTQAQFLKPMVVAIGFGVVFALFLTLFFVPALYAMGVDIKRGVLSLWRGERVPGIGSDWDGLDAQGIDVAGGPGEAGARQRPGGDTAPQPAE
ncbi:efflux RND transporter permease subunit [Alkalicaulis satelles]|uniref:Efflux RND transporter permease subunit n=1 Tax=Alkalicaulis satelles TaxID=2609175 RepID=A0A5M6ZJH7_9PROT|nr:efflux RND transporter permease subunit [Alkalicaulis satelles]KAA5804966.1 efflux RND transporter permease subunit [Alkalicaulis satelles]